MANLLVRGVDETIVRALKERAGSHGRSAEAEHRAILSAALVRPVRRSFAQVPASSPMSGWIRISNGSTQPPRLRVYSIDTNVVSEARQQEKTHPDVTAFLAEADADGAALYLSVVTVGELRRGVESIRHRGGRTQAQHLEAWLQEVLTNFRDNILNFDADAAQVWRRLRVPHAPHDLDKQIAAIALVNDLKVVTRNTADFAATGIRCRNPFSAARTTRTSQRRPAGVAVVLSPHDQANRPRFDRLAVADGTHVLCRLGLHAHMLHRHDQRAGDALAHGENVRRHLG
ncbi:hypothetical protein BH11PSE8_BH11PSE8_12460 [soil metagenome]